MLERLRRALSNRRFRTLLLAEALALIAISYALHTIVDPIVTPRGPIDFFDVYLRGAQQLASGRDPYTPCLTTSCWVDLGNAWWFYPPLVPWLAQPLVHLDRSWSGVLALAGAQLCVAIFVFTMVRALRISEWQGIAVCVLTVIAFPPLMSEVVERNLQLPLLALSAVWFAGWLQGDRWWAGVALGAGVALKIVQAPLLLLALWFRRKWMSLAALVSIAALWLVGAPRYLGEYLFQVLPIVNSPGAGPMNVSVLALVQRLIHPQSIYETAYGSGTDLAARVIGYAIAGSVLVITGVVLRAPRAHPEGRGLEAALAVAASPLLVSLVRPGQLLLSLLPILVLGALAVRLSDWRLGSAVAASWILMGPAYLWFSVLLASGIGGRLVSLGNESAIAGCIVLWVAALQAIRHHDARFRLGRPAALAASLGPNAVRVAGSPAAPARLPATRESAIPNQSR